MIIRMRRGKSVNPNAFVTELFARDYIVVRQDEHIMSRKKIDLRHVQFENFLRHEYEEMSTMEQIKRISQTAYFPLDAQIAQSLILQKGQIGLEWLRTTKGITRFACVGTVFKNVKRPADEYILWIEWRREGCWIAVFAELGRKWLDITPAAVL